MFEFFIMLNFNMIDENKNKQLSYAVLSWFGACCTKMPIEIVVGE